LPHSNMTNSGPFFAFRPSKIIIEQTSPITTSQMPQSDASIV